MARGNDASNLKSVTQISIVLAASFPSVYSYFVATVSTENDNTISLSKIRKQRTRANNVSQSERLLTFCVIDQSERMKLTICKQKEWENSTLLYDLRAIRYCTFHFKTNKL